MKDDIIIVAEAELFRVETEKTFSKIEKTVAVERTSNSESLDKMHLYPSNSIPLSFHLLINP